MIPILDRYVGTYLNHVSDKAGMLEFALQVLYSNMSLTVITGAPDVNKLAVDVFNKVGWRSTLPAYKAYKHLIDEVATNPIMKSQVNISMLDTLISSIQTDKNLNTAATQVLLEDIIISSLKETTFVDTIVTGKDSPFESIDAILQLAINLPMMTVDTTNPLYEQYKLYHGLALIPDLIVSPTLASMEAKCAVTAARALILIAFMQANPTVLCLKTLLTLIAAQYKDIPDPIKAKIYLCGPLLVNIDAFRTILDDYKIKIPFATQKLICVSDMPCTLNMRILPACKLDFSVFKGLESKFQFFHSHLTGVVFDQVADTWTLACSVGDGLWPIEVHGMTVADNCVCYFHPLMSYTLVALGKDIAKKTKYNNLQAMFNVVLGQKEHGHAVSDTK